jgi:hypothetical protein
MRTRIQFEKNYAVGEDKIFLNKVYAVCKKNNWLVTEFGIEKMYPEKFMKSLYELGKINSRLLRIEKHRPDMALIKPNIGFFLYELKNAKDQTREQSTINCDCYDALKEYLFALTAKDSIQQTIDAIYIIFHCMNELREVNLLDLKVKGPNDSLNDGKPFYYVNWKKTKYKIFE